MSCSDELVSKDYLENRLAQIDFQMSDDGQNLVVKGLVGERMVNFGTLFGAVRTLIQFAVDGIMALLGIVPNLIDNLRVKPFSPG